MDTAEPIPSTTQSAHGLGLRSNLRTAAQKPPGVPLSLSKISNKDTRRKWTTSKTAPLLGKATKEGSTAPNLAAKTARLASAAGRRLVPLTERKSEEEKEAARGKRENGTSKWDVAPDGGSAGREGRQFTVANVGNNGRIYLRPTVRPAHQRYPQPDFNFPVTPPGTSAPDPLAAKKRDRVGIDAAGHLFAEPWTSTTRSHSPMAGEQRSYTEALNPARLTRHRRAMSDSTVHEVHAAKESKSATGLKVVIAKPGDGARPRSMEDVHPSDMPLLHINIPSWRIGTPRFSLRGTPLIRGSSYAPTEENRSSYISVLNASRRDGRWAQRESASKRPADIVVPPQGFRKHHDDCPRIPSLSFLPPLRSTYMPSRLVIEPAMFDDLTFSPNCHDRSIVRYASTTGAVTAATPPRLVAEITSPSFLDYELISDFFLTFRTFLEPLNLLRMLLARLRWALSRQDEIGMVVRVRAFVALRHWILNYFLDDFVPEYELRVTFCNLLNGVVDDWIDDVRHQNVQVKILAELKKCWRRVCGQFWEDQDLTYSVAPDVPISPGGIVGGGERKLDPAHCAKAGFEPSHFNERRLLAKSSADAADAYNGASVPNIGDFVVLGDRPITPEKQSFHHPERKRLTPTSPHSLASLDVVSCPFPLKTKRGVSPNPSHYLALNAVHSGSSNNNSGPVAVIPKTLVGKRVRPGQGHKRNNSLTDSLREHGSDKSSTSEKEEFAVLPSAGSLVRGNMMPPGQAFVDIEAQRRGRAVQRQTTLFNPNDRDMTKHRDQAGAMSGYGMKKLIGSVRRALGGRIPGSSPTIGSFMSVLPAGPRGVTTNRLPGTAVVPQERHNQNGMRPPVRIDLLGAEVAEDFKKAIREEEEEEKEEQNGTYDVVALQKPLGLAMQQPPYSAPPGPGPVEYSAANMESPIIDSLRLDQKQRPFSDMGMTTGSKSIVIVDDTMPLDLQVGNDAFIHDTQSEIFTDGFEHTGADPTPPNTPPGRSISGTPRRSSHLLNQNVVRPPSSLDTLPPFIPDLSTLDGCSSRISEDQPPLSYVAARHSMRLGLNSGEGARMHRRNASSRSQRSHKRRASFTSGFTPRSIPRSFNMTTSSRLSVQDDQSDVPVPEPLRVLRRRPGGDLRAANNIEDLNRFELRRSQSVGSFTTTYTDSVRSSYLLDSRPEQDIDVPEGGDLAHQRTETFSVGQLTENVNKRDLSLFSTHSSKPNMSPAFEAEAERLARIPDQDDGGVESALSKLEGRSTDLAEEAAQNVKLQDVEETETSREKKRGNYLLCTDGSRPASPCPGNGPASISALPRTHVEPHSRLVSVARSFLSDASQDSYSYIPIAKCDNNGAYMSGWADRSILCGSDDGDQTPNGLQDAEAEAKNQDHLSFDFIQKTDNLERISARQADSVKKEDQSFLDDESLDLSSELSADEIELSHGEAGYEVSNDFTPLPFGDDISPKLPESPSPPMTLVQALNMAPDEAHLAMLPETTLGRKSLPTPDTTPKTASDVNSTAGASYHSVKANAGNLRKYSVHLPFILAFESDVLAQQFTLIEKDALNEIDWKELIDMNWKNAKSKDSRSWVEFLRDTDAQGVEVVIARFNIMVKWAISEIVLTQHIEERVRCIIKFIHIAAHCRRYRNFATLAQLTIALSSNEVARLAKTWEMVPMSDIKTLSELELLVTPMRNFYNIREEMEAGTDEGCIPFVGIYTHDLLYNAQRPSEIAGSPTSSPLVNFERCRVGAAVVKTLLRLLEASTRYSFQPIEGVTERCLWMGALTDDEIRRHSESLE